MSTHGRRQKSIVAQAEALLAGGHAADALGLLSVAHRANPGSAAVLVLSGRALCALGQHQAGIGAFMLALQHRPDDAAIHAALSGPMVQSGNLPNALHHAAQAFRLAPSTRHATVLSVVLLTMGDYAQALVFTGMALELGPNDPVALINQALALDGLGQHAEALATGARAIAAAPTNSLARYHQGERLLGAGAMTPEAWALYDARIAVNGFKPAPGFTVWAGEAVAGTLLLHAEQGFGDTLQFVRYAPFAAARAGRVVLAVQKPLVRLLQGTPGIDDVVEARPNPVPFDVVCPLVSLPGLAGTTLGTIPPPLPYAADFQPWVDNTTGWRVGLVWAGNPGFVHDARRSAPLAELAVLAGIEGMQFYSLQQHRGLPPMLPPTLAAIDLMLGIDDFHDTAACIAGLDLVVCVDTAVAHLAATMNKPVWLLSRHHGCWRWLHDGADTPWYPTMRIYRQTQPGGWQGVLQAIRQDLAELARLPPPIRTGFRRAPAPPALAGSVDFGRKL